MKKFVCILMAAAFLFSAAACNSETDTDVTTQTTAAVQEESTTLPQTEAQPVTDAQVTEEETTQPETTQAETQPLTEKETEATTAQPTTEPPATTKAAQTTAAPTTEKQVVAPSAKADIVKLYNEATIAASQSKPGYSKSTETVLSNLSMGALSKISVVRDAIGGFLGEGKSTATVKKGSFDGSSLVKSTLKESDVTSATCKLSADKKYYIVTINVKSETNPSKSNSALGRFTKDYKDVSEIKQGLSEVGASVGTTTLTTNGVTINAKISVDGNRFESLTHTIKMSAVMSNVKYSFAKVAKATASLSTTVKYTSFKY